MTQDRLPGAPPGTPTDENEDRKPLAPAARRALDEAKQRRKAYLEAEATFPAERGGRGGLEPVRYGDWEIKGLASDF